MHPADSTLVFAGTAGGAFRTASNGFWNPTSLNGISVNDIVIDSSLTLYAGTATGGVFKSASGFTWNAANAGLTDLTIAALAVDPQNASIVYGATSTGAVKTTTGAQSWAAVNSGLVLSQVRAAAIDPQTPDHCLRGRAGHGVFKSLDGGRSWASAIPGSTNLLITALAIGAAAPSTIYAAHQRGWRVQERRWWSNLDARQRGPDQRDRRRARRQPDRIQPCSTRERMAASSRASIRGGQLDACEQWNHAGVQIRGFAIDPSTPRRCTLRPTSACSKA